MIVATQWDRKERQEARQDLEDRVVGTTEHLWWNTKCILPTTVIVHKILHTVYLGMLNHWIDWITFFLVQHSRIDTFNKLWVMMTPYLGCDQSNKPYSHVPQWSGKELVVLRWLIGPELATTVWNHALNRRISFQLPFCVSRTPYIITLWHSAGTILKPWSSTWRSIWGSFIVTRRFSVDSGPFNLQRRFRKP